MKTILYSFKKITFFLFIILINHSCLFLLLDDTNNNNSDNSFTDSRDGTTYKIVTIGDQIWMAENLAYLPEKTKAASFDNKDVPAYFIYGTKPLEPEEAKATDNFQKYGVLYNWEAAQTACPTGWHLPADQEWEALANNISADTKELNDDDWLYIGTLLKSQSGWLDNGNGTDDFGFNALPGGNALGNLSAEFLLLGEWGIWWSSTLRNENFAYSRQLSYKTSTFYRNNSSGKTKGFSIRCIKD